MTRTVAPARPRCAQGFHKHYRATVAVETKICPVCLKQKSWVSFDDELGTCVKCKYKKTDRATAQKKKSGEVERLTLTRLRKCPVCLQRVTVTLLAGDWTLEAHTKKTRTGEAQCSGGEQVLYRERLDAMDHLARGTFEGGKRR